MSNIERKAQLVQIIRDYLNVQYESGETNVRLRELFVRWFDNEQERAEKEQILIDELSRIGVESDYMTPERIDEIKRNMGLISNVNNDKRKLSLGKVLTRVAAVLLPIIVIGGAILLIYKNPVQTEMAELVVPADRTESIELADGTKITVNAGSKIKYPLKLENVKERVVELEGEAFFSVKENKGIPFLVKAENLTVSVLGTEFNVDAFLEKDKTTVTLVEGLVNVSLPDGRDWQIEPNNQFSYDRNSKEAEIKSVNDVEKALEWVVRPMICELMNIHDIFNTIEQYFNVKIKVDPSVELSNGVYTIHFNYKDSPQDIMSALKELVAEFNYIINDDEILIIKH